MKGTSKYFLTLLMFPFFLSSCETEETGTKTPAGEDHSWSYWFNVVRDQFRFFSTKFR